jgi:His/Glu/Gln/Arg/opine family amino acid ABC transporter permease subunit
MHFKLDLCIQTLPFLLQGLKTTIGLTLLAMVFGIVLGLIIALLRISRSPLLRGLSLVYVDTLRGTPLLLQILVVYYVFPGFGIKLDAFTSGVVALSFNSAAYISEIFRAGIESISIGQFEAANSIGMNYYQTMKHVILPQTIRRVIPPITNEIVALLKDTSLVMITGIAELTYKSKQVASATANVLTPYLAAGIIYLLITIPLTRLSQNLERRFSKGD